MVYYLLGGSMDSKISSLIDKLKLTDMCINKFKTAKLEKIVANKEKTSYCFYIIIDEILDLESYEEFVSKLNDSFNSIKHVNVIFNPININYDYLIDYFKYLINKLSKSSSMLTMFFEW